MWQRDLRLFNGDKRERVVLVREHKHKLEQHGQLERRGELLERFCGRLR